MDDCVIYKLNKDYHIANVLYLSFLIFFGLAELIVAILLPFLDEKANIVIQFVGLGVSILCFTLCYFKSKIIIKVKWYKDHFALCTRYGETSFSFDKKELHNATHNMYGHTVLHFKKGRKKFHIEDEEFPEVVKMLNKIYGDGGEEIQAQEKDEEDYIAYKTLSRYGNKKSALALCALGIFMLIYLIFFAYWNASVLLCIFWGGFSLIAAYKILNAVVEIRWYKDKFVLCTLSRKGEFSFDKTNLQKMQKNQNGFVKFVFGKQEWDTFVVDERDFPKVIEKLKKIFCDPPKEN